MQMADLNLKSFHSLSDLLSPLYYNNLRSIPPREPGESGIAKTLTFRSYISKDAKWGYMYNGPTIKCFPIDSDTSDKSKTHRNQSQLVLNTGTYYFQNCIITCVTELTLNSSRTNGITKLLVGLNCGVDGGALVVYDPISGQPIKWISTPAAVSSVLVLSNLEEGGYTRPFFSEAMVAMVGIVAVGFYGGQIYLIDLGLDDVDLTPSSKSCLEENKVFKLTFVDPHEEYVAPKRRAAAAKKLLISIDFKNQDEYLDFAEYDPNTFYYSVEEEIVKIPKESVCVACMEYVPAIGSLVVGFNFGGFQIWRVDNTSLEYTSALSPSRTPVHSICYQLPVDDPKNFCYLWVLYGTAIIEMQVARATFFALFYEEKEESEHSGPIFHTLQTCVPRLSFDLQDFYLPGEENASFEADESIDSLSIQRFAVRPLRMWSQTDNLVFFTWECTRNDAYILGIFDLNQWYSAQTPIKLNCVPENQLNPFWAAINFTVPFPIEPGHFPIIYDLQIIPKTLERWENPHYSQDVHLYPASITFQANCVSSIGTFVFEHFGIQEKLLRVIQKDGYHLLTEPAMVRQLCENYGVTPFLAYGSGEDLTENDVDRFFIFTALLESRRPSLIIQIANRWIDGVFANLGCTLDLILMWIKGYNHTLRLYVEDHWTALLSNQGDLTPETAHCLNYSNFMWNQINGLLMTLARHDEVYDNMVRSEEVEYLQFALDKLVPYTAALLMLHKAGILPVKNDFDVMALLQKMCSERRVTVRAALHGCHFLEPEHKQIPQLLIDALLRSFQELCMTKDQDQEEFVYPPPHPIYIFNMLLGKWSAPEMKIVSRIIFYFILDITQLLDMSNVNTHLAQFTLRGDFSSMLKLTAEEQNEVLHLWYIDHGVFEKPLLYLCNGYRNNNRDLPWASACILLAAQGCEEPVAHILRHFCFPKAGKLYINLLSLNESTFSTTLTDLLLSDVFAYDQEVLFHCLEVLERNGLLHSFIGSKSRHAPLRVQEGLVAYMNQQPCSFANDSRLLLFYMTNRDDKMAEDHFERMKVLWGTTRSLLRRDQEDWTRIKSKMESYISNRRGNFIMNFMGYEHEHTNSVKPLPLKLETKVLPSTPVGNINPHLKRLMGDDQSAGEITKYSPLRHFSARRTIAPEPSELSKTSSSFIAQSPCPFANRSLVDLNLLLRTPKISRTQAVDKPVEFSTPTGVHGILRARNASSVKVDDTDLSVRFLTEEGVVSVGSHTDLTQSDAPGTPSEENFEDGMSDSLSVRKLDIPIPVEPTRRTSPKSIVELDTSDCIEEFELSTSVPASPKRSPQTTSRTIELDTSGAKTPKRTSRAKSEEPCTTIIDTVEADIPISAEPTRRTSPKVTVKVDTSDCSAEDLELSKTVAATPKRRLRTTSRTIELETSGSEIRKRTSRPESEEPHKAQIDTLEADIPIPVAPTRRTSPKSIVKLDTSVCSAEESELSTSVAAITKRKLKTTSRAIELDTSGAKTPKRTSRAKSEEPYTAVLSTVEADVPSKRTRKTRAKSVDPCLETSELPISIDVPPVPRKRNLRTRSRAIEIETSGSETPKRTSRAKSEEPYTTIFDTVEADVPTPAERTRKRTRSKSTVQLDTSDCLEELELLKSVAATPKRSGRSISDSLELDASGSDFAASLSSTPVSISDAVKKYDLRKERSKSPASPIKPSRRKVFGYAPSLSIVAENSASYTSQIEEEIKTEPAESSILAATIVEEPNKRSKRVLKKKLQYSPEDDKRSTRQKAVKKEPEDEQDYQPKKRSRTTRKQAQDSQEDDDDAKSTTSSTKSGRSSRSTRSRSASGSTSSPARMSTRAKSSASK